MASFIFLLATLTGFAGLVGTIATNEAIVAHSSLWQRWHLDFWRMR
jgi:hypothetical protein